MRIFLGALLFLWIAGSDNYTHAQSYSETALNFSRTLPAGSSRMMGIGGAGVSLGGDPSSAHLNPAGLGMFNKGEFTIALGYGESGSNARYLNETTGSNKSNLNIPFMGIILHSPVNRNKIISGTMALSLSRINDFNQRITYSGRNKNNSIIDYFLNDAYNEDGQPIEPEDLFIPTNLAFESYLIDTISVNGQSNYWSALGLLPDSDDFRNVTQGERITTKGAQTQWTFSYGINAADKFFAGAGFGIRKIRFESRKTFQESNFEFLDKDYNPIKQFGLEETLSIDGSGVNFQVGFIARPFSGLQVGASWESPTYYEIVDVYNASLNSEWNNFDYYQNGSLILKNISVRLDEGLVTDYKLRTPGRITAGFSYIFGKRGFITGEAETVNYNNARYTSLIQGISFDGDNSTIKSLYRSAVNYRVGGELRVDNLRLRLGGFFLDDPFKTIQNNISRSIQGITAGAGYREKKFYFDLSVVYTNGDQSYRPYRIPGDASPVVTSSINNLAIQATLGLFMVTSELY